MILKRNYTTFVKDGTPKQGETRQALAFSNHILIQQLKKEVNVGDWALSWSPGFRVLGLAFAIRSPSWTSGQEFRMIREQRSVQAAHSQFKSGQAVIHDLCALV